MKAVLRAVDDETRRAARYAWSVFALLFALMVVNYVDRQIVVSLLPHLKVEWGLSDAQLGGLVSIVSIAVALGTIPFSLLADRWGRAKSIVLMALIWSLATIACAFSGSYLQMLGARSLVGLGEAAYGTAGAALIAGLFPSRVRSTMLSAFLAAAVLGSVLGVMLGGMISERWGWPAAFGIAGVPGIVLALLFWLLARDSKVSPGLAQAGRDVSPRSIVRQLLRPRTLLVACIGGGLQLLVVSAIYAWLPSYLHRTYGLSPGAAGIKTALVILIGGLGAVFWGIVADRLAPRLTRARLYVPAAVAVMTTVMIGGAFSADSAGDIQFWLIAAGGFVMTGSIGPVASVVIDVSHPGLRATALSILALVQNLLGLAGGPLVMGVLADRYGLSFAMSVVPVFSLVAAVMFAAAARTYLADVQRVEVIVSRPGRVDTQGA